MGVTVQVSLSRRGVKPPVLAVEIEAALPTGRETLDMIPFWVYHGIMNKQEHRFPVRFPLPLWEQLEQLAEEEERSMNWEVIQAVRERIARKRPESKKPREQESV
jgi:hypothetical protein